MKDNQIYTTNDLENRYLGDSTILSSDKPERKFSSLNIEQSEDTEKLQHIISIINKLNS